MSGSKRSSEQMANHGASERTKEHAGLQAHSLPVALLNQLPTLNFFSSWALPFQLLISIEPCHSAVFLLDYHSVGILLPPLSWSFLLFLSSHPFFSWPGSVCWPCLVSYFLSLVWTLSDASSCTLPHAYNKNQPPL